MPKESKNKNSWQPYLIFLLSAVGILAADQISKILVRGNLVPGEAIPDIGFFRIHYVQNSGAVFGIFQDQAIALAIFGLFGAVLIAFFFYVSRKLPPINNWRGQLALGLVLGGNIGNMIDRLAREYVTDFIEVGPWPEFNIADSAVVIGVILILVTALPALLGRENQDGKET